MDNLSGLHVQYSDDKVNGLALLFLSLIRLILLLRYAVMLQSGNELARVRQRLYAR
jgi:hypothetical protein